MGLMFTSFLVRDLVETMGFFLPRTGNSRPEQNFKRMKKKVSRHYHFLLSLKCAEKLLSQVREFVPIKKG